MPFHVPPVTDERDGLAGFLAQQQGAFRAVIHGLTDDQAGLRPTPSALSVGALVKHVTWVQRGWVEQARCAPGPAPQRGPEVYAEREAASSWLAQDTVADVLDALDSGSADALDAVRTLEVDTPVPVPPAPWNPPEVSHWSVRWVWLHLIEELARHAGHADIIREAIDGATMYELVAAKDGVPETPWLKPWRRPSS